MPDFYCTYCPDSSGVRAVFEIHAVARGGRSDGAEYTAYGCDEHAQEAFDHGATLERLGGER
ncbi:hypothetical protein [Cryptosporangium phraense]|uniref:Uncharacterized protein n=1 Tax=Cryptosporangium phraense TaxID=2593070 RepID=A0A545ASL4_9ACTN|nr:hypothetical protein [Cryptosporangium phraense]TQS44332.1 hypothetical protein FL583_15480 [Cryptosporangium phraense]